MKTNNNSFDRAVEKANMDFMTDLELEHQILAECREDCKKKKRRK